MLLCSFGSLAANTATFGTSVPVQSESSTLQLKEGGGVTSLPQTNLFLDDCTKSLPFNAPFGNEEKEESEEELEEEEIRFKRVLLKTYFLTHLIHCHSVKLLSDSDSNSEEVAFHELSLDPQTSCDYILFQVFRL